MFRTADTESEIDVVTWEPRELTVESGTSTLAVRAVGPEDAAQTVVLLHGGPGLTGAYMRPFEALAGSDRQVVTYDQRGCGGSTAPSDGDYALVRFVDDVEAIRIALGVNTVHPPAHSWAGAIAHQMVQDKGDRVASLLLVDAPATTAPRTCTPYCRPTCTTRRHRFRTR